MSLVTYQLRWSVRWDAIQDPEGVSWVKPCLQGRLRSEMSERLTPSSEEIPERRNTCTKADSWCEPVWRLKSYERNKCNSQRYGFMTLTNLGASQEFPLFAPGASFRSCFPKKERIHAYKCFADNTRELRPISETNTWKPVCWYNERETFFCRGHWKHIQHFASRGNEEAEMH